MKPIDFIKDAADDSHNTPAGEILHAITNEQLVIYSSASSQWEVVSYYYNPHIKQMVIDIQPYSGTQ